MWYVNKIWIAFCEYKISIGQMEPVGFNLSQIFWYNFQLRDIWDKVFKNGSSKICGRQPLRNLKKYGLLKQTISLQTF